MFSRPFRPPNTLSLRWLVDLIAFVRWLARIIAASSANQRQKHQAGFFPAFYVYVLSFLIRLLWLTEVGCPDFCAVSQ